MNLSKGRPGWRIPVTLIILVGMLIGYFWVHKPLDFILIASLGGSILDLITACIILVIAAGLGRRLLKPLQLSGLSRSEKLAVDGLIGLGTLGLLALLLGFFGAYRGTFFCLLLIIVLVVTFRSVLSWSLDMRLTLRSAMQIQSTWAKFLVIASLLFLAMAVLHALAPPYAYDSINYHLIGPQTYLRAGRIVTLPNNLFMGFPQSAEIVYGLAIGLFGRDTAPALIHMGFGLFGLLAIGGLIKKYVDTVTAYIAVALILSAFSFWLLFGWAYVDLAMFAYGAISLTLASCWREALTATDSQPVTARTMPYLIVLGIALGFAMSVKYSAVGLVGAVLIFLLWYNPRQIIRNGLIVGIAAAAVFVPWALKGLIYYQNPLYPFVFGGVNWDAGRTSTFSTNGFGWLNNGQLWQLPILPFAASIFGVEKGEGFSFTIGPWLLTAPFLLIFSWRWLDDRARLLIRDALLIALPLLAYWGFMSATTSIGQQTRLMLMGMPAAACLAAIGFHSLSKWPRKPLDVAFLARAILIMTISFGLLDSIRDTFQSKLLPTLLGATSREEFLTSKLGVYTAAMDELAKLPEGSQVRILFESRGYYCPQNVTCLSDILFDYWARPLKKGSTPDQVFQEWRDEGDDYVLVYDLGYTFNATDVRFINENALFPDALKAHMEQMWTDGVGGYTLYKWK